jgi:CRP/FNR family transcriptional regulator, dissimilatory nitrate respiration regulator
MPKPRIPICDFLATLPLFQVLDASVLTRIAAGVTAIDVAKGGVIVRRGEPSRGMHVVVYGQVKLSLQTPRRGEKVVDLLARGQSFGESAMFLGQPYLTTAEALVDSKLLHLSKETVFAEVQREPLFAGSVIERLSRRLNTLIEDVEGYTLRSGTQRVVNYLLRQLPQADTAGHTAITFPVRKGVIASKLNLTQEHFSRILHELIEAGMIEVQGRVVRVLDGAGLRKRAA